MKAFPALAAMFGWVLCQGQPQDDPVEARVRRLQEQLQLTDEQTAKMRESYKKHYEEIKPVLTEEQRQRYEDSLRGGSSGQGSSRSGGLPSTDELKLRLTLTEDQVVRLTAIQTAARDETRTLLRNRPRGGNTTAESNKIRDEANRKIRELVMTEAQRPRFEEIVRASQDRQETAEERAWTLVANLGVTDLKEAEALKSVVQNVVEFMDKVDTFQREARRRLDDAARNRDLADQVVGDRIDEVHNARRELEKRLGGARNELAGVVTNRQELELIRRGILR